MVPKPLSEAAFEPFGPVPYPASRRSGPRDREFCPAQGSFSEVDMDTLERNMWGRLSTEDPSTAAFARSPSPARDADRGGAARRTVRGSAHLRMLRPSSQNLVERIVGVLLLGLFLSFLAGFLLAAWVAMPSHAAGGLFGSLAR